MFGWQQPWWVFLLWQLSASLGGGLTFHFLMMTLLTLMFGAQFALLSMSLALLGVTFEGGLGWLSFGFKRTINGVGSHWNYHGAFKIF